MDIIFLHGLGQSPSSWNDTISYLLSHIRAHCPALFGSNSDAAITYAGLYSAFEAYAEQFSEPVNLCGISLGAVLALHYAINHPGKLKSLTLIAPQYKMPKGLLKLQNMLFRGMPEKAFSGSGLSKQSMLRLTGSMMELNFEQDLGKVLCPTFIICGKRDWANMQAAKALSKRLSRGKCRFLDGAGHEVNIAAPKELANAIACFLADQEINAGREQDADLRTEEGPRSSSV